MYNLTEFTLKELRELNAAVNDRIENKKKGIEQIDHWFRDEDGGPTKERLINNMRKGIPELREMNVRILTAIEMVKSSESIQSN